jgi:hypothetical protein
LGHRNCYPSGTHEACASFVREHPRLFQALERARTRGARMHSTESPLAATVIANVPVSRCRHHLAVMRVRTYVFAWKRLEENA